MRSRIFAPFKLLLSAVLAVYVFVTPLRSAAMTCAVVFDSRTSLEPFAWFQGLIEKNYRDLDLFPSTLIKRSGPSLVDVVKQSLGLTSAERAQILARIETHPPTKDLVRTYLKLALLDDAAWLRLIEETTTLGASSSISNELAPLFPLTSPAVKQETFRLLKERYPTASKFKNARDVAPKRAMDAIINYMFQPQNRVVAGVRSGEDLAAAYQKHLDFMREIAGQEPQEAISASQVMALAKLLQEKLRDVRRYVDANRAQIEDAIEETGGEKVPTEFELVIGGSVPWGTGRISSSDLDALFNHYLIRNLVRLTESDLRSVVGDGNPQIDLHLSMDVDFNLSQLARRTPVVLRMTETSTSILIYPIPEPTHYAYSPIKEGDEWVHSRNIRYPHPPIELRFSRD